MWVSWLSFDAVSEAGWPTCTSGAARACVARIDRRVTYRRSGVSPHHTMACGDVGGRETDEACSSVAVGWSRIARRRWLFFNRLQAGCGCVGNPGWLWPLRMAKRVSGWAARGGERQNTAVLGHRIHGTRLVVGSGANDVGSFSWRSRARRLGGSVTRRRGGPSGHRPSGRDPETPELESRRSA